jgi:hypothetical protein
MHVARHIRTGAHRGRLPKRRSDLMANICWSSRPKATTPPDQTHASKAELLALNGVKP